MILRLKKSDTVLVIAGRDRGKRGRILRIFPKRNRAIVEGVHMLRKHLRRTRDNPAGGIASMEGSIHLSNLMLVCPHCAKPARIGFTFLSDGSKKRTCKRCQEIVT